MSELLKNIHYEINVAQLTEVDYRWNTKFINKPNRVIPYSRIYFPVAGEAFVSLYGKEYHLRPGQMYLFPPFAPISVSCPTSFKKYWTHFNAFIANSDMDIFSLYRTEYELPVGNHAFTEELFNKLVAIHTIQQRVTTTLEAFEAGNILGMLLTPFLQTIPQHVDDEVKEQRFTPLLLYIEKHLSERLTLKEMAKTVHLHPTYLSNLFAETMGRSLFQYINERRVRKAIKLLWHSNRSVSETADKVGIGDVSNFSRMFKKYTGLSPAIYKAQIQQEGTMVIP